MTETISFNEDFQDIREIVRVISFPTSEITSDILIHTQVMAPNMIRHRFKEFLNDQLV